ncbi:hypothetical protein VKT23_000156 [Stygiomarasmius scandens]|uniref:G domain-containing protein n=1 Tax=Marasmiellus scandens TaxID=2682957 RepID=A0ABR1K5V3_9AGAR
MTLNTLSPPSSPIKERRPSMIDEELTNSAQDILDRCPRFRILVLGKTGAGKSSIINAAFGVTDANVSHSRVGESDIYQEITSPQNPRFVLHDSKGFATGEIDNLQTVKRFIDEKAQPTLDIKDKLHAIWCGWKDLCPSYLTDLQVIHRYCIEIPTENGALFEVADSEFMKIDLQKVPIIVVFTKFDLLVSKLEMEAVDLLSEDDEDLSEDDIRNISLQAEDIFQKTCVEPLKKILAAHNIPMVPYIRVSTRRQHEDTLAELTTVTRDQLDEAVWLIWACAQRASANLKIDACVKVGQRSTSQLILPGQYKSQDKQRLRFVVYRILARLGFKLELSRKNIKKMRRSTA